MPLSFTKLLKVCCLSGFADSLVLFAVLCLQFPVLGLSWPASAHLCLPLCLPSLVLPLLRIAWCSPDSAAHPFILPCSISSAECDG